MNYGVQKCIWTALGDITANIIQAILVIFVLGSFFVNNPNFLNIFKWIGIAYLLYLSYDIYNSRLKDVTSDNISSKSFLSFFKDGFLVAGTSPKAWMFFPLIFPQFIDFNSNYVVQFLILIKINCLDKSKSKNFEYNFSMCININCDNYNFYSKVLSRIFLIRAVC